MNDVDKIAAKVAAGGRLSTDEALVMAEQAPLWMLARLAFEKKQQASGDAVFYNRNFHIEPTNVCVFNCRFCSYKKPVDSPEAWDYSMEEMEAIAQRYVGSGVTEVHIVGGVHPRHTLESYLEIIRRIKSVLPQAAVKAYTAIELGYMIDKAGISYTEGLQRLKGAGMDAIPGGGAEIFDEEVRERICPEKGSTKLWLEVHEAAHGEGLTSNATILYGHVENWNHRIDHMNRLRELQDRTGGFNAFIPLKYRSMNNSMSDLGEVAITEDMRMMALSRIFLDNFPHIKAYWPMFGKTTTELALAFGADDIDGTIDDSTRIYSMAGAEEQKPSMSINEIERMAASAGLRAVERDTFYNVIKRQDELV